MDLKLTNIDYIIFLIYVLILFLFVYYKQRKIEDEEFLISKRNLNTFENIMSINAGKTGAILIGYTALVYLHGISALWFFIGMITGYIIFIPFGIKLYKLQKNKFYTLADYFYKYYGNKMGKFISILCVLLLFGFTCINLVGIGKIMNLFTQIPYWICIFIIMLIIISYIIGTGFKSVIKTDIIQYISIFIIVISIAIFLITNNSNLFLNSINNLNFFNIEPAKLFGFFLIGILFPFSQPDLFQRVYASKNINVFKKSMIYSILIYFFVAIILTIINLIIINLYPLLNPDTAFVIGLYQLLPVGFNGFLIVCLFAAFMSSLDTYLYTTSSSFVQGLLKTKKSFLKNYIRILVLVFGLLAIFISIFYSNIIDLSYVFASLTTIIGMSIIISWIWFKIPKKLLFFISLISFLILAIFIIYGFVTNWFSPILVFVGFISFILCFFIFSFLYYIFKR